MLARRSRHRAGGPGPLRLVDLARGQTGCVAEVRSDEQPAAARRLEDLGFAPGALVEVVRPAPLGDPVVYRVAGSEIALRRAQAAWVLLR